MFDTENIRRWKSLKVDIEKNWDKTEVTSGMYTGSLITWAQPNGRRMQIEVTAKTMKLSQKSYSPSNTIIKDENGEIISESLINLDYIEGQFILYDFKRLIKAKRKSNLEKEKQTKRDKEDQAKLKNISDFDRLLLDDESRKLFEVMKS